MKSARLYRTSLATARGPAGKRPLHPVAQAWRDCFGDVLPAAFLCRGPLRERWLRIHSLPDARRYAGDRSEAAEMLLRQNAVAEDLLGDGALCLLIFARWNWNDAARWPRDEPMRRALAGRRPELMLRADADGDPFAFFAVPVTWRRGRFDDLILACANDQTGPMLFANVQRRSIYAPYDGGADLFFGTPDDVAPARERHRAWLSSLASGM